MKIIKVYHFFIIIVLMPVYSVLGQNTGVNKAEINKQANAHFSIKDTVRNFSLGYGITSSSDELTAALGRVDGEKISESMVINPLNALYGRVPGLTVLGHGGNPPSSPTLYIRGLSTFRSSSPLIIIDGFERPISLLTPDEIKSVTVLKDAAGLAKFGQHGANGVLLIKTKRGNKGKLSVNASYSMQINQPTTLPKFVRAFKYAKAYNEALANDGEERRYSANNIKAFKSGNSPYLFPNVDWFDKTLRDKGTMSNFNINFRGGNDNVKYFSEFNMVGNNGIYGAKSQDPSYSSQIKYNRIHLRTNLDIDATDNLLIKINLAGNIVENNIPHSGCGCTIFDDLYSTPSAVFPVRTSDGSWGGTQIYSNNPVADLTATGYGSPNDRSLQMGVNLKQDLSTWAKGLSAQIRASYYVYGEFYEHKTRSYAYEAIDPVRNSQGTVIGSRTNNLGQDTDLKFNGSFGIGKQANDVLGKVNYDINIGDNNSFKAIAIYHQSTREYNGSDNTYHRRNIFTHVQAGFSHKYFIGLSSSYGGNNWMKPGDRYGFFPAVSAEWLISNEKFLQRSAILNRLKLRASWGIIGSSDDIPTNDIYRNNFGNGGGGYWFKDSNNHFGGFEEKRLANRNLTFAKSHKLNVGIEAKFIRKLDLKVDLFYDRRTNILTGSDGTISNILGIGSPLQSNGIVKNKGADASITWQDAVGSVQYHIGGQFSFARNEIVNKNEQYRPYSYLRRTGHPVGQEFGLKAIGLFKNQEDINNSPEQTFSQVKPGDFKYKDQNNDGIINQYDEVPLGYSSGYPQMYFSASLGFDFKRFSVSALFQGTGRYTAYLNTKSVFWPLRDNTTISEYYYNRRWTPAAKTTATLPRLTTENNVNNLRRNSMWLVDRSYVKLRNLIVIYEFPASITKPLKLSNLKVFLRGQNLFSIDSIPVLDPEQLSAGYPSLRSFSGGLAISF